MIDTKCNNGFSLVELVIASAVLFTVLMSVVGALVFSAQSAQMQRQKEGATNIANGKLEIARNLPYDNIGIIGGNPSGDITATVVEGNYTINTAVKWQRDPANGKSMDKNVSVDVVWTQPRTGHMTLSTNIFGKTFLSDIGDVEVRARYLQDGRVAGSIACSVAGMSDSTDGNGIAFFAGVPTGVHDIAVAVPSGYVYDYTETQQRSVAPDSLTTIIVTFQKASSVNYTFRDSVTKQVISGVALSLVKPDGAQFGTAVTDAQGIATFANLVVNSYILNYTKSGYTSTAQSLSVTSEDSHSGIDVFLTPVAQVGSLVVAVQDGNTTPLKNAKVILQSAEGTQVSQYTSDNDGAVTFSGMAAGNYTIITSYAGYQTQNSSTVLVTGTATTVVIVMSPNAATQGKMAITAETKNHKTIANTRIVVTGPNNYFNDAIYSNASGYVLTDALPAGSYTVRIYDRPLSIPTVIVTGGTTSPITITANWN